MEVEVKRYRFGFTNLETLAPSAHLTTGLENVLATFRIGEPGAPAFDENLNRRIEGCWVSSVGI